MRVGTLADVNQLRDDVCRGRPVGITHAHIDNVFAASARGKFQLGGDIKDVRRKAVDARKAALACRGFSHYIFHVSARNRPSDAGRGNTCTCLGASLAAACSDVQNEVQNPCASRTAIFTLGDLTAHYHVMVKQLAATRL